MKERDFIRSGNLRYIIYSITGKKVYAECNIVRGNNYVRSIMEINKTQLIPTNLTNVFKISD